MTEDQLEQETLSWLAEVGYTTLSGYDISMDGNMPERKITLRFCYSNIYDMQ